MEENSEKIKIVGVGGAGINTVNNLIRFNFKDIQFVSVNTNLKSFECSKAHINLPVAGLNPEEGRGTNGNPSLAKEAAYQNAKEINKIFQQSRLVFMVLGLGGGTGTGAAPVISEICKNLGAKVFAIASIPFSFEGKKRHSVSQAGIKDLYNVVDELILLPNDNMKEEMSENDTLSDMFFKVDENIYRLIKKILSDNQFYIRKCVKGHKTGV